MLQEKGGDANAKFVVHIGNDKEYLCIGKNKMNNKREKYLINLEARVMKRLEPLRREINLKLEQDAEFRDRFEKVVVALKVLNYYGYEKISNQRCIFEQIYAEDYLIK